MTPEFLIYLNQYTKDIKRQLPGQPPEAAATILQLLAVIDYMKNELTRWEPPCSALCETCNS